MQRKQRFVADQRYDLPQHESMLSLIDAEFATINSAFYVPTNKIVKGWEIINNGGLSVKVKQDVNSFLFNSERPAHEAAILWKTTNDALLLTLADNATNYVEVQITTSTCASDTVALWDTTANGGQGEEFTQTIDTQTEELPVLVSNTISFTGDPDKLPLAIVTTAGGVITNIDTTPRDFLFHVAADWDFGVTRTDKTIGYLKDAYDALATSIRELKGAVAWYDAPSASAKTLKEYQNMFISGGGAIEWEGSQGANTLGWDATISIEIADRASVYTILAGSVVLADGQAMYVDIPAGVPGGALTPVVAALSAVPIDPASPGFSQGIQVLFFRRGNTVYGMMDIPELDSGEVGHIGLDLPADIRDRLGIIDDSTYEAYTSTLVIASGDSYATAISKLDAAVSTSLADTTLEEDFTAAGGETVVNFSSIAFSPSNASWDLKVYLDGVKMKQDVASLLNEHYRKISGASIEFSFPLILNEKVTGRMEKAFAGSLGPQPYFVNYFEGLTGTSIPVGDSYNTATKKLSVYRNGLYMVESASGAFFPGERYIEQSLSAVAFGLALSAPDWIAFINDDASCVRTQSTGLTGAVLTVPTYTMGDDSLRVYRNGVLMNSAGLGTSADQYTETSTTTITLALAATAPDAFTYYVTAAPTFRQDVDGLSGSVLTLPSPITMGDEKLLVFKNGVLLLNSNSLASASERYQETSTTQITLGAAAISTDVFTYIYK